jgi:ABC-2 type transport system permease protein
MSLHRILVIARENAKLLISDPAPVAFFFLTPLLIMSIMRPTQALVLSSEGFTHTNGSEQVVPGFTAMFSFFWVPFIGQLFFQEYGWGTWERLLTTSAKPAEVLIGKILPGFVIVLAQITLLFIISSIILGLTSAGPLLALLIVLLPQALVVISLTLALVSICRTFSQIDAGGNVSTMLFATLGGSFVPVAILPAFARTIAPATPTYWTLKAARNVILLGDGVSSVLVPAAVTLAFAACFTLIAAANFRFTDVKVVQG